MPSTGEGNYERQNVDWLVMLYLSGDNNLSSDMVWAINEIRSAGVPPGFGLTIQYDALAPGAPTKRYRIDQNIKGYGPGPGPFPFPEAEAGTLNDQDAASPEVLADFVRWSVREFNATHRMLILSGHGSGMVGDFLTDDQARQEGLQGTMTIRGLREAIEKALAPPDAEALQGSGVEPSPSIRTWGLDGPALHVLGMDSCLMSTLEVATELARPSDDGAELVTYLVASEGFVPNTGWPYGFLLGELRRNLPAIEREAQALADQLGRPPDLPHVMCRHIVKDCDAYYRTYLPAGVSFDIAACEVSKLPAVSAAVASLTAAIQLDRDEDDVILAHWRAQSFKFDQYTDLYDFCDLLLRARGARQLGLGSGRSLQGSPDEIRARLAVADVPDALVDACADVMEAIDGAVFEQARVGIEFQHSHGLSIYFPWNSAEFIDDEYAKAYGELAFVKDSRWLDFLRSYVLRSMREERPLKPEDRPGAVFPSEDARVRAPQPPQMGSHKYSAGYNKYSAGYNKFLTEMLGGRLPWSMKNPPQRVRIPGRNPPYGPQPQPADETVRRE